MLLQARLLGRGDLKGPAGLYGWIVRIRNHLPTAGMPLSAGLVYRAGWIWGFGRIEATHITIVTIVVF